MITLVLFAALPLPLPLPQNRVALDVNVPIVPEQLLAWQLEGVSQEETREEVRSRGLTEYPE